MKKAEVGFWLLIIGVVILLWKQGMAAYQRGTLTSPDSETNYTNAAVGAAAVGAVLLWPRIS